MNCPVEDTGTLPPKILTIQTDVLTQFQKDCLAIGKECPCVNQTGASNLEFEYSVRLQEVIKYRDRDTNKHTHFYDRRALVRYR